MFINFGIAKFNRNVGFRESFSFAYRFGSIIKIFYLNVYLLSWRHSF